MGGHSRLLGLSLAPSSSRTVSDEKELRSKVAEGLFQSLQEIPHFCALRLSSDIRTPGIFTNLRGPGVGGMEGAGEQGKHHRG